MSNLAIRGHETRGKEVIEILEMLGGHNIHYMNASDERRYYYNSTVNVEILSDSIKAKRRNNDVVYTLEEFLEKFPYKIGDKVSSKYLKNYKIERMEWEDTNNRVIYKLQGMGWYSVSELQPYKEEDMETITIDDFKANTKEWLIDKLESMSKDNALQAICNIHDELHKSQYPKTYEECCEILRIGSYFEPEIRNATTEECYIFMKLMKLKRCRDAYWKIAGEQMGLGESWEPDWIKAIYTCTIISRSNKIIKDSGFDAENRILAFPTEEMRDAFYENFEDLIEECKEFL